MSKTLKHQRMWLFRHNKIEWPETWHPYGIDTNRASYYYKLSYKKLRHKWTRLLYENDELKIGSESLKPENMDWVIW